MHKIGSPSAVCAAPFGRCGVGCSAGPPALVLGEEELSGRCDRREENHSSWKSYPCRCRYSARTFSPHSRLLRFALLSLISICRPLRPMQNWVKTHTASRDAKQLHDVVACISVMSAQIYYRSHNLFLWNEYKSSIQLFFPLQYWPS